MAAGRDPGRRQQPVPDLLAHRVVKPLDGIEQVLPGLVAEVVHSAPALLPLARGEETPGEHDRNRTQNLRLSRFCR